MPSFGRVYTNVSLGEIIVNPDPQKFNWTTPSNFQCQQHEYCFTSSTLRHMPHELLVEGKLAFPRYRHAYSRGGLSLEGFQHLQRIFPGFDLETGMACSLGCLMEPSALLEKYEPQFFTELLPALNDETILTMATYIRTGRTDYVASMKLAGATIIAEEDASVQSA